MTTVIEKKDNNVLITDIITSAIQIPGVKVNRNELLMSLFKNESEDMINRIIQYGPIEAGVSRKVLRKKAKGIVDDRTLKSSGASFLAGLPGGLAMAASIPADMLQFYGVALRLAQEVAYIYGEEDLWDGEGLSEERVKNQLLIYCGTMLGVSTATATIRVLSAKVGQQLLKTLPQKALTKTFYYPIVKSIAKAIGVKMTKQVFSKGVSKVVPILGGLVSGGLTFVTMQPMGIKLIDALDDAHFDYSQEELDADMKIIKEESEKILNEEIIDVEYDENNNQVVSNIELKVDQEEKMSNTKADLNKKSTTEVLAEIKQAKELLDMGVLSEEEFNLLKSSLLAQI